ncbi:MAG: L,D-transpeptidase [Muribaculaceae bacterium]|nr:L,D-transpeptidase [Muribaculaceae bacterium]
MWLHNWYSNKLEEYNKAAVIIIDKQNLNLRVIGLDGETKASFGISCGKSFGNKQEKGDNRTPEGIFRIQDIQDSSGWKHDFGDGNGEVSGAYGPWFIRLCTDPHKGIGIHGTHDPGSIGTRATEGCIRLKNEDVAKLKNLVYCGLNVVVLPSEEDIKANIELRSSEGSNKSVKLTEQ